MDVRVIIDRETEIIRPLGNGWCLRMIQEN